MKIVVITLSLIAALVILPAQAVEVVPVISTFLANEARSGRPAEIAPDQLSVIWKTRLGCGTTKVGRITKNWCGAGWTGQPLLIKEDGKPYLIQGAYDHSVRKIDATTGRIIWRAPMPNVVKGTPTYYENPQESDPTKRHVVIAGSRVGSKDGQLASLIALSYLTGRELWRFTPTKTASYSRDVDGSPLIINGQIYANLENGFLAIFDPTRISTWPYKGHHVPKVAHAIKLFSPTDAKTHRGNLVAESSPARSGNILSVAAGSGHVYFFELTSTWPRLIWDFYIGSDLDGSPVFDSQGYVYITVEKEYIKGNGGIFKLDPKNKRVVWYYPTGNRHFADWDGGVVGSVALDEERKTIFAAAIDGYLYCLDMNELDDDTAIGPDGATHYPMPYRHWRQNIGGSIASPVLAGNHLLAAGYNGLHLYELHKTSKRLFTQLAHALNGVSIEATPIAYQGVVYVAARNGYLYALGKK